MKVGTEGFVGARLREAREARGLTAAALSDLLGLTRAAVSQYEHGHKTPSPEIMQRICSLTRLPDRFFMEAVPAETPMAPRVFYRSRSAATKSARTRSERKLEWLARIVSWMESFVAFPAVDLASADLPETAVQLNGRDIESAADNLRRHWGLGAGPISNVAWLLENHGILVSRFPLHADALDSFSEIRSSGRPFVVLSSDRNSAVRSRFDAAHELGHLVLHEGVPSRDLLKPAEHHLIEEQAHRFASAFLMPTESFSRSATSITIDGLKSLKQQWGVSMQAIVMRLCDLDIIGEDTKTSFFRAFGARGWRKAEPLDDQMTAEQPELLRQALEAIVSKRVLGTDDILASLPYDAQDIEELCGVRHGTLASQRRIYEPAPIVQIERPNIMGEVIPFRAR